jgi:hypothetical protein
MGTVVLADGADVLSGRPERVTGLTRNGVDPRHSFPRLLLWERDAKRLESELSEKAKAYSRGDVPMSTSGESLTGTGVQVPDPALVALILRNLELIAASLDLPPYRRGGRVDVPRLKLTTPEIVEIAGLFEEEIQLVRAARNTVAHAGFMSTEVLRVDVDVSEQLLRIIRNPRLEPPEDWDSSPM